MCECDEMPECVCVLANMIHSGCGQDSHYLSLEFARSYCHVDFLRSYQTIARMTIEQIQPKWDAVQL